jgi:hypothetical protein
MTRRLLLTAIASAAIALTTLACQEPTSPKSGYMGGTRTDRGLDTDTYSPGTPHRSGTAMGETPGNLPKGENAPTGIGTSDIPSPASPAADRAPGSTPPPPSKANPTPPPPPLQR